MNKFLIVLAIPIFLGNIGFSAAPNILTDAPCDITINPNQEYQIDHDEFIELSKPKAIKNMLTGQFKVCFEGFDKDKLYHYKSHFSFRNVAAPGYKGGYFSPFIKVLDKGQTMNKMILHDKKTQSVDNDLIIKARAIEEGYGYLGVSYCTRKNNKKGTSCKYNNKNRMEKIEFSFEFVVI